MHPLMLKAVIECCQQRIREGDCPTVPAFPVEQLEEAVVQLNRDILLQNAARAGQNDEHEQDAGVLHWEAQVREVDA